MDGVQVSYVQLKGIYMEIIKRIYYFFKHEYHECRLCNGHETILIPGFEPRKSYEGRWADSEGKVRITCPECKGTAIVWG